MGRCGGVVHWCDTAGSDVVGVMNGLTGLLGAGYQKRNRK